ncbi:MAG: hypothetical protein J5792_04090, partial [Bacteroidales bacterium]|nr:hypothetical protein [Bacteroidales bacterium]
NAGKLTWDDFQLQPAREGQTSNLEYFIWNRTEKSHFDTLKIQGFWVDNRLKNVNVYRTMLYACVDTDSSWAAESYRNEAQLRYNQVLFDIFAYQVRKAQVEADGLRKPQQLDSLFQKVMDSTYLQAEQYRNASDFGNDLGVTVLWENKLQDLRSKQETPAPFPSFAPRRFGIGAHAGLSGDLFTGSLGEHFMPVAGLTLGVDFSLGRSVLGFNGNVDYVYLKKAYYTHQSWTSDNTYELFQGDITYGLILHSGLSWRWMPFAGIGLSEISNVNSNEGVDRLKMSTVVWKAGLCADYKLCYNLNYMSNDLQYIALQGKCYLSYANFYEDLKGLTVNVSLSVNIFDRFIEVNRENFHGCLRRARGLFYKVW